MSLRAIPITLREANAFVRDFHRHHAPVVGHRWSVAVGDSQIRGVAICGRPKARAIPFRSVLEINRVATDGTKNACSKLYSMCAAIAKLMGFADIETSILARETGVSLVAAGFTFRRIIKGRDWNCRARGGRRTDQPMCDKQVWGKKLS